MNRIIGTQKPNGEWVYLPEDFLRRLSPKYFQDQGLGFLPVFAPLVAGKSAATAIGAGKVTKIAGSALKIIPNLFKNNFWKDAGPAVDQLNSQAKNQLQQSQQVNQITDELIKASDSQNLAFANALQNEPPLGPKKTNYTPFLIAGGILVVGGVVLVVAKGKKDKSKAKS